MFSSLLLQLTILVINRLLLHLVNIIILLRDSETGVKNDFPGWSFMVVQY